MLETATQILTAVIPLVALYLVIKILLKPIKWVFKLLINTSLGFACLFLLNMISGTTGIIFELNLMSAALVGILGVPGIVVLVVLHFVL